MTRNERIKQAYAYGAAVALQELGYAPYDAQQAGVKLAMEKEALTGAEARAALETLLSPVTGAAKSIGGAAKNVGRQGGDLLAALRGKALPGALFENPELARMARLGLGAGAVGGAGLGAGGMALGNALSD